ncbi:MAG TPA: hypothetical protein VJU87_05745 [Gemmatimonadaceae bacterium]|nr:hypothetical protein [Gemmatimonadaceae bacterium]
MRVRSPLSIGTLLLVAVAACQDTTSPRGTLSADESAALAVQLGAPLTAAATASSGISADLIPSGASAASSAWSIDVTNPSLACPRGGTTAVSVSGSGTADPTTHSLTANITGTQQPTSCGFLAKGRLVYLTAAAPITTTVSLDIENGLPVGAQTVTVAGSFSYTVEGGAAQSCSVDYTATSDYTTDTSTVDGQFCNTTLHYTGPIPSGH